MSSSPLNIAFLALVALSLFIQSCSERRVTPSTQSEGASSTQQKKRITPSMILEASSDRDDTPLVRNDGTLVAQQSGLAARNLRPSFTDLFSALKVTRETVFLNGNVDNYFEYRYQTGALLRRTWFISIGADTTWFTNDDVVSSYVDFKPAISNVTEIRYVNAGVDQTWFTADDQPEIYKKNLLDASGKFIADAFVNLSGLDGVWFTDDDVIAWIEVNTTTPTNEDAWIKYTTSGTDNDWTTLNDNTISEFVVSAKNVNGNPTKMVHYGSIGPDAQLFTADDVPRSYRTYSYDAQNEITDSLFYSGGPGADGIWFTADDVIRTCRQLQRDAAGLPYRTVTTRPGLDGVCFNTDDEVRSYHLDQYDATTTLVKSSNYVMPGIDNVWFNADDVLGGEKQFGKP